MKTLFKFAKNKRGAKDVTGVIISLIIAAILVFNLFETWYSAWISSNQTLYEACPPYYNETSPCPTSHRSLFGVNVLLVFIGIIVILYKGVRVGR